MSEHIVYDRRPLWMVEFGERYAVPDAIANDPRLIDTSWHHDVCPSFTLQGHDADALDVRLWVDHPDSDERELDGARLMVCDNDGNRLFASEDDTDAPKAIAALEKAVQS